MLAALSAAFAGDLGPLPPSGGASQPLAAAACADDAGAVAAAATAGRRQSRPLVVEWPQVKAMLAMADAALRARRVEYEVRKAGLGGGGDGMRRLCAC